MTDESTPTTDGADGSAEDSSARRPSPTSRARRIGGRPMPSSRPQPAPRPQSSEPAESSDAAASAAEPVSAPGPRPRLTKPAPASRHAVDDGDEDDAGDGEPAGTGRAGGVPGALRWLPAGVLGAVVVVLLAVVVVASHGVYWAKSGDTASGARTVLQERVLAATKKCFATVNTYDYRKLGGLEARDAACATGKFKADLKDALLKTIIPQAPKQKATQTAQVTKAGVISVTGDGTQWTVLVYAQLSISNTTTTKSSPRIDLLGAVVTVDKVGDKYLMAKVDFDTGSGLGS